MYITKPTGKASAECIAGILGSRLISFFIHNFYDEQDLTFPQIKVGQLKNIPIPEITEKVNNEINSLVTELLTLSLMNHILPSDNENRKRRESFLLEQIDESVFQLYQLTPEEVEEVKKSLHH